MKQEQRIQWPEQDLIGRGFGNVPLNMKKT